MSSMDDIEYEYRIRILKCYGTHMKVYIGVGMHCGNDGNLRVDGYCNWRSDSFLLNQSSTVGSWPWRYQSGPYVVAERYGEGDIVTVMFNPRKCLLRCRVNDGAIHKVMRRNVQSGSNCIYLLTVCVFFRDRGCVKMELI